MTDPKTLEALLAEFHRDEYDDTAPLTGAEKVYLLEGLQHASDNCAEQGDEITAEILKRIRAKLINRLK